MARSSKYFTVALLFTLIGCGAKPKKVIPHSIELQALVNQNLRNERIPTVGEVEAQLVPAADNACLMFQAKLPKSVRRETIEVPEDATNPDGQKIKIFYYGQLKKNTIPIFFYNGGPGASSHNGYRNISRAQEIFDPSKKLSFIFIDQRGNGCSDFYPQGSSSDVLQRLTNYGTIGIVNDSEIIRKKLIGDQKIISFGQSYGAFITHRYATMFPHSLKAGFAHANTINADAFSRQKARIKSQVRISELYFKQFPDDRNRIEQLANFLTKDKCFSSKEDAQQQSCGWSAIDQIPASLLGFNDQWNALHGWIEKMVPPSGPSEDGIAEFLATFSFSKKNPLNSKRHASHVIGMTDRNTALTDSATCNKIRDELASENIALDKTPLTECAAALQFNWRPSDLTIYSQLKKSLLSLSDFVQALTINPELNFYVYSGEKDPYLPVENFAEEVEAAKHLPNFRYTNFPSSGHEGFKSEPLLWQQLINEANAN